MKKKKKTKIKKKRGIAGIMEFARTKSKLCSWYCCVMPVVDAVNAGVYNKTN